MKQQRQGQREDVEGTDNNGEMQGNDHTLSGECVELPAREGPNNRSVNEQTTQAQISMTGAL